MWTLIQTQSFLPFISPLKGGEPPLYCPHASAWANLQETDIENCGCVRVLWTPLLRVCSFCRKWGCSCCTCARLILLCRMAVSTSLVVLGHINQCMCCTTELSTCKGSTIDQACTSKDYLVPFDFVTESILKVQLDCTRMLLLLYLFDNLCSSCGVASKFCIM